MGIKGWLRNNLFSTNLNSTDEKVDKENLRYILQDGEYDGDLGDLERRMIVSVLDLEETLVKEIIVPQPDVISIQDDMPVSEIPDYVSNKPHTRYPVVTEDNKKVLGFIDVKDIISMYNSKEGTNVKARDIARDIPIFPETTTADELLISLQEDNKQMAAVIDEWGSLEGIVTIEDIVEVIVGDIRDGFDDPKQEPSINKTGSFYEVDGHVPIRRLNRVLRTDFEVQDGAETVAGLVLSEIGEVPSEGEKFEIDSMKFEILSVDKNRIDTLKIQNIQSGK